MRLTIIITLACFVSLVLARVLLSIEFSRGQGRTTVRIRDILDSGQFSRGFKSREAAEKAEATLRERLEELSEELSESAEP